jgi:fumarate reductase subunit C
MTKLARFKDMRNFNLRMAFFCFIFIVFMFGLGEMGGVYVDKKQMYNIIVIIFGIIGLGVPLTDAVRYQRLMNKEKRHQDVDQILEKILADEEVQ